MKQKKDSEDISAIFLKEVIGILPKGVFILNAERCIIAVNKQGLEILGINRSTDAVCNKDINSVISHIPELIRHLEASYRVKKETFFEHTIKIQRGKKIAVVSIQGRNLPYGRLLLVEDVKQVKEIDRMKAEFVSMASHQLRTPLTAIRWYLEELFEGELGKLNDDQMDYLRQALDSNTRMIKLVKNLLNISRLEDERLNIDPQSTDLGRLIEDVIAELKPLAQAKNCSVLFHIAKPAIPKIKIDPALITQVVVNLLSNSIKYSSIKGKKNVVHVRITKKRPHVIVSVQDSGVGIPKAAQHRVFEKFYRAYNITKLEAEGTGLGLYIAKLIVEASGGTIWFESELGESTTFSFTLPLVGSKRHRGERTLTK